MSTPTPVIPDVPEKVRQTRGNPQDGDAQFCERANGRWAEDTTPCTLACKIRIVVAKEVVCELGHVGL